MADRLIDVIRYVRGAKNAFGEVSTAESVFGRIYARQVDLTETETLRAGAEYADRMSAFVVRSNALSEQITTEDALRLNGQDWDVQSNLETTSKRRGVRRIVAKLRVAP